MSLPSTAPAICAPAAGETDGAEGRVLFDALLYPNRSLPPAGFKLVLWLFAVAGLAVGGLFLTVGAWPILGFYGLEFAVLYWFLARNTHDGRIYEKVRLTARELRVERGDHRGPRSVETLPPHWLQVRLDDPPDHDSQLVLSSHGRSLIVASFLSPAERAEVAQALRRALDRLRGPPVGTTGGDRPGAVVPGQ